MGRLIGMVAAALPALAGGAVAAAPGDRHITNAWSTAVNPNGATCAGG